MSETGGWAAPGPEGTPKPEGTPEQPGGQPPTADAPQGQQGQQGQYGQPMPAAPPPPQAGGGWGTPGYGKPGVIPLRPLNLGELLDGAIATMRKYPGLVLGVSAIVAVVSALLGLAASVWVLDDLRQIANIDPNASPEERLDQSLSLLGDTAASTGVSVLISILATTFLSGFLTVVIGKAVLGRPVTFGETMAELKPRLLPLLGLTVVYTLLVAVGTVLCIVPGVWLYVLFGLATPALVLERGAVGTALSRSRTLVQGSWWRVFGILLLTVAIAWVIAFLVSIPFSAFGGTLSNMFSGTIPELTFGDLVLSAVGEVIASTFTTPFVAMVTVLLYVDQRMRKEGMDIELARAASAAPPAGSPPQ